jgi:hypothetical protein
MKLALEVVCLLLLSVLGLASGYGSSEGTEMGNCQQRGIDCWPCCKR